MLVATAYHPSLFDEKMLEQPDFCAWMSGHLVHLAHSHMVVTSSAGKVQILSGLKRMIERLLPNDTREVVKARLEAEGGRFIEISGSGNKVIDALVIPSEVCRADAQAMYGLTDASRICTWREYTKFQVGDGEETRIEVQLLEYLAMGSVSIKRWPLPRLQQRVLHPVLKCTPYVQIVDKFIGRAFVGRGEDTSNWASFERSICMLFQIWMRSHECAEVGDFAIITCGGSPREIKDFLVDKLHGPNEWTNKLQVSVRGEYDMGCYDAEHDRYLVTAPVKLAFSRGFDLISMVDLRCRANPPKCNQCSISIYKPSDDRQGG